MTDKYNGWTNYATWRVNLEMFDGVEEFFSPESARDLVESIIEETTEPGIARDYAMAFLDDVNWYEIATNKIQEYK